VAACGRRLRCLVPLGLEGRPAHSVPPAPPQPAATRATAANSASTPRPARRGVRPAAGPSTSAPGNRRSLGGPGVRIFAPTGVRRARPRATAKRSGARPGGGSSGPFRAALKTHRKSSQARRHRRHRNDALSPLPLNGDKQRYATAIGSPCPTGQPWLQRLTRTCHGNAACVAKIILGVRRARYSDSWRCQSKGSVDDLEVIDGRTNSRAAANARHLLGS